MSDQEIRQSLDRAVAAVSTPVGAWETIEDHVAQRRRRRFVGLAVSGVGILAIAGVAGLALGQAGGDGLTEVVAGSVVSQADNVLSDADNDRDVVEDPDVDEVTSDTPSDAESDGSGSEGSPVTPGVGDPQDPKDETTLATDPPTDDQQQAPATTTRTTSSSSTSVSEQTAQSDPSTSSTDTSDTTETSTSDTPPEPDMWSEIRGRTWTMTGHSAETQAAGEATVPSLTIGADGSISGSTGCNSFVGAYELQGSTLAIVWFDSTDIPCAGPLATQDGLITAVLSSSPTVELNGRSITLGSSAGWVAYRS